MTRKQNAALDAANIENGGGQQTTLPGFELSENQYIIDFCAVQGSIAAILPHGRADAVTTRELAALLGLSAREVTRAICRERRAGAPILSDPGAGFWLAADTGELRRCANNLHKRAGEIHKTARALEKLAEGGEHT